MRNYVFTQAVRRAMSPVIIPVSPTGANDDAQINRAMYSLPATGGTILLSEGTFFIGSQLLVPSNTRLVGSGIGTVLKLANGKNIGLIRNKNWGPTTLDSDITICNLSIDGNKAGQSAEANDGGISLRGVDRARVYNCNVKNFWGFGGIYLAGSESQIYANHVTGCKKTTGSYGCGIYVTGNGENRVVIADNVCVSNEGTDYFLEDYISQCVVKGNISIGAGRNGIWSSDGNDNNISNNIIIDADSFAIEVSISAAAGISRIVVTGNTINNTVNYDGILIKNATICTIDNNTIYSTARYGINLDTSVDCIVNANAVDNCANYNIIEQGTSDYNIITSNNVRNGANKLSTVGANSIIANNRA